MDYASLRPPGPSQLMLRATGSVPAPATVQTVWNVLVSEMPALVEYERAMSVAVNAEYARMAADVHEGDEIAFLPPVSGG